MGLTRCYKTIVFYIYIYIGHQAAPLLRSNIGFNTQYRTSDVAENLGRYVSYTKRTSQENDFKLILKVK